ncbi:MAG: hypothetical protein JXA25_04010 [Anaerolineales bacterium]|nr:hypothetical protein [Anaerolineales bacterium]
MANPTLEMIHGMLYGYGIRLGRLSGLGRIIAAMSGTYPDHVPFQGPQMHDHAMTVARVPARKFYWEADVLVDVHLAVCRWYGFDSNTITFDVYNLEVEALGAKMIYSDNAMPTVDVSNPLIKSPADLEKYGPLDPSKGRIPYGIEVAKQFTEKAPGPFAGGLFCSPWSLLCQAMGYPPAVRAMKRDKVFMQALFDWAENQAIWPYMEALRKFGIKNAMGADAWAAFPNLTPELIDEWVIPSSVRMKERGKKELGMAISAGAVAGDYCEEDPGKFDKDIMFKCWDVVAKTFPMKLAASAMGRTQDWNMHWLYEYATRSGKKMPIMGALNGRFVRDSSPEQITDKVREWIDILGRDGRFLMMIGNIPADSPPINIHTAVEATRVLGRYPIAANLSSIAVEPPQFKPFDEWLKGQPEEETILKAREWKSADRKVFT